MLSQRRPSGVRDVSARRILIVDDNADSAELLVLVLGRAGYEVSVASTPAVALRVAPDFRPHLALIDIGLPDMNGYELVRALRAQPQLEQCRFIAVTGYSVEHAPHQSEAAGFDFHLTKPVDFEVLLNAVARVEAALG
jgi:CheY-like chemotaxis protein